MATGGDFSFSTSQATSAANSIKKKGNDADQLMKQLDREIRDLATWWKGDSAQAFISQFTDNVKPSLDKLVQCVGAISDQLNKIATIKAEAEANIAKQLRQ